MLTTAQRLEEARTALHDLMTGKAVVRVSRGGRLVEFRAHDIAELRRYIAELEAELNHGPRRRPFGVTW